MAPAEAREVSEMFASVLPGRVDGRRNASNRIGDLNDRLGIDRRD